MIFLQRKVKPLHLLFSCLSAMALLDYAITVCICGLVGRVVVEELRPLREEMRMVGEVVSQVGEEGVDNAGYR